MDAGWFNHYYSCGQDDVSMRDDITVPCDGLQVSDFLVSPSSEDTDRDPQFSMDDMHCVTPNAPVNISPTYSNDTIGFDISIHSPDPNIFFGHMLSIAGFDAILRHVFSAIPLSKCVKEMLITGMKRKKINPRYISEIEKIVSC